MDRPRPGGDRAPARMGAGRLRAPPDRIGGRARGVRPGPSCRRPTGRGLTRDAATTTNGGRSTRTSSPASWRPTCRSSRREYDRACQLDYAPGVHGSSHTFAARFWTELRASFPSAVFAIDHRIGREDPLMPPRAALRWSLRGRHDGWGKFGAPTGADVYLMGASHAEFGPWGLRREYVLYDEVAVWKQILLGDRRGRGHWPLSRRGVAGAGMSGIPRLTYPEDRSSETASSMSKTSFPRKPLAPAEAGDGIHVRHRRRKCIDAG